MVPAFSLRVDGEDVTERVAAYLAELRVVASTDETSDHVELALADDAAELAVPKRGRELGVSMGYAGDLVDMGTYAHAETEIELSPRLVRIRGVAADMRSVSTLKAPKTRSWDGVTLGDVVRMIASEHDYAADVAPSLAAESIAHIDQTAESDLHLLRRLARHYDATAKVASNRMVFSVAAAADNPAGEKLPAIAIPAPPAASDELRAIRGAVTRRDRSSYGSVQASYADAAMGTLVHVVAGDGPPAFVLRDPRPDAAQATAAAAAKLAQLARQSGTLSLTVPGDPAIVAAGRISLSGWGTGVDDLWTVTRATHTLNSEGYLTALTAEIVL